MMSLCALRDKNARMPPPPALAAYAFIFHMLRLFFYAII